MRVAIADDSGVFRESLARSLREIGFEIVVEAADGTAFVEAVQGVELDVAVVDVDMPPSGRTEGIAVARRLHTLRPGLPVLLISAYTATPQAIELLQTFDTHIGYLHKNHIATIEDLASALHRLRDGESVIDADLVGRLLDAPGRAPDLGALSVQELQVLRLMAEGYSNAGIARTMSLSERTVEDHVSRVFAKLGLTAAHALEAGARSAGGDPGGTSTSQPAPGAGDANKRVLAVLLYLRLAAPRGSQR